MNQFSSDDFYQERKRVSSKHHMSTRSQKRQEPFTRYQINLTPPRAKNTNSDINHQNPEYDAVSQNYLFQRAKSVF